MEKFVQHSTLKQESVITLTPLLSLIFCNKWFISAVIIIAVIITGIKDVESPLKIIDGGMHTNYNNYLIFKNSFLHFWNQENLYIHHPTEYFDLYKYSPTFALLMAPFAKLPDIVGLPLWNLINALPVILAILLLSRLDDLKQTKFLWLIAIELLTSVQNEQSNGLMVGFIALAFIAMEKQNLLWATLFIVLTFYIKIFGLFAAVLIFFYPNKLKSIGLLAFWMIFLGVIPAIFTSFNYLIAQYQNWVHLVTSDQSTMIGMSAMGMAEVWLHIPINKGLFTLLGLALFLYPLKNLNNFKDLDYRLLCLASILLWIVLFNHKAESPTFVIAVFGVGVWYFITRTHDKFLSFIDIFLLVLVLAFTVLSPTDIFPRAFREEYVKPYMLKTLPCFLVWLKVVVDMIRYKPSNVNEYNKLDFSSLQLK